MSTIGDLAAGLKANLDTIDGINVSRYPRSNPVPPLLHLWPEDVIAYHRAHQMGLSEVVFTVQLIYAYTDDAGTAAQVYDYLDPSGDRSVRQAVESDPTLGGAAQDVICETSSGLVLLLTPDNQPRLTAEWSVRIIL